MFRRRRTYLFKQVTISLVSFFCLLLLSSSYCQTDLVSNDEIEFFSKKGIQPFISNNQDGDYPAGTYLVLHDLVIEKGKIMTLYPGTKILFKKDTRLVINGVLICQGKSDAPIIFEKLENKDYYDPVDSSIETWWDGIYLSDSATLEMQHTEINNSKYGIIAKPEAASLSMDSIKFFKSKYHSLRFGTELPDIPEGKLLSITWSGLDKKTAPEITVIKSIQPVLDKPQPPITEPFSKRILTKKSLRWTSGVVSLIGAGAGIGGYMLYKKYDEKYRAPENRDRNKIETSKVEFYENRRNLGYCTAISGAAILFLGIGGFTLTYIF